MHLVVLAAGLGTRFGGLKQLAPVGPHGEAILDVLLTHAAGAGFGHGVIVVRAEIETSVREHLDAFPPPVPVTVVVQPVPEERRRPLGTAHAVLVCRDTIDGHFAVVNADDLYPAEAFSMLGRHLSSSEDVALVAFRLAQTVIGDRPVSRAVLRIDGDDRILSIDENRALEPASVSGNPWVSMNMWGFPPSIFAELETAVTQFVASGDEGEVLLPDVAASLVERGVTVTVLRCEEPCIGITYADDIAAVRRALA